MLEKVYLNDLVLFSLRQIQAEEGAGEQVGLPEKLCGGRASRRGSDTGILHPTNPEMDQHQP